MGISPRDIHPAGLAKLGKGIIPAFRPLRGRLPGRPAAPLLLLPGKADRNGKRSQGIRAPERLGQTT